MGDIKRELILKLTCKLHLELKLLLQNQVYYINLKANISGEQLEVMLGDFTVLLGAVYRKSTLRASGYVYVWQTTTAWSNNNHIHVATYGVN